MERQRQRWEHDNPAKESMNNFHGHMPGGIYRPGKTFTGAVWDRYGHFLNQGEETWPEGDRRLLSVMKVKQAIQKDIDAILGEDPWRLELWQAAREDFVGGGSLSLREFFLRPIYVKLREKYTEEDLSS